MSKKTVQRQSQIITTFGPGAMVDLPTRSVLIGGLDRWIAPEPATRRSTSRSLARILENWLRERDVCADGRALRLLTPPLASGGYTADALPGIDVTVFPDVVRLRARRDAEDRRTGPARPSAGPLARPGCRAAGAEFEHEDGKKDDVTPLRFVGACPNGHLQDIDWRRLVHGGDPCRSRCG